MAVKRRENMNQTVDERENALVNQIGDMGNVSQESTNKEERSSNLADQYIGTQLTHNIGRTSVEEDIETRERLNLSKIGEKIGQNAEIRQGWLEVDRALLGERDKFYPSDWKFKIKPAEVEAIRNWSTINENNANSIDEVFNEILKCCLSIQSNTGSKPWHSINSWDRFFFILLIREYSFKKGESNVEYTEECPNCECPVTFTLNSQSLMYDMPDPEVMNYYDTSNRTWNISPLDFDVDTNQEIVTLYLPTLEKDANIKAWLISKYQENRNYNPDRVFLKFLPWMLPKISKDLTIANTQIRNANFTFKQWGIDMFQFMNEVIDNINVTPGTNLIETCQSCGEEVTSPIRFQNGIGSLFNVVSQHKKFGKK